MGCYNSQMKSKKLSNSFFNVKNEMNVLRNCLYQVCELEMPSYQSLEYDLQYIINNSSKDQLQLYQLLLCYKQNFEDRKQKLSRLRKSIQNDDLSICSEYILCDGNDNIQQRRFSSQQPTKSTSAH
ncbi:hypothetical protein TTHERM_00616680 (macronuclear) [Tetrahymena thermophila SB210]|uniref:Uncharacterized protein n=1 Tax=Tetrahymena thermophila (strain SB210) TaxID=312017 RepID=I7MAF7_TETTS|nr:hypothetical protein TTHERM_00616680 [Tetrahymena thermophila SB210]EAS04493.4 hypothetical protein TTHERM_00616680 [Tetrahymena thermophila SB210]|eukprot:XP_001024738.4 hypothetical protein TTHERM_00616680 [Tetrahymena thermophila SB210]